MDQLEVLRLVLFRRQELRVAIFADAVFSDGVFGAGSSEAIGGEKERRLLIATWIVRRRGIDPRHRLWRPSPDAPAGLSFIAVSLSRSKIDRSVESYVYNFLSFLTWPSAARGDDPSI